nr:ubiquitin hydrolase [Tanacetum cinerariifolium]
MLFPPPAQVYSPPKKDMSWTGLPEFADDTITDYSRPSPTIESNSSDLQNSNSSISDHKESSKSIMSKPMIKFIKAADCPGVIKNNKTKTTRKPPVKYAEIYRNTIKSPKKARDLIRTRKDSDTMLFPPPAQVYSPPKKDMSWIGLPEFADDTITDYSRPSPTIESNSSDLQNSNSSVSNHKASLESIMSKPMIKFVKAADCPEVIKNNKTETARKPPVKYAKMYRNTTKSPKVRGNQRNWNNLKTQQLGKDFVMKNKACFNCGQFDHLAYNYSLWVEKGKTWAKNSYTHKSMSPRTIFRNTGITSSVNRPNMNVALPKRTSFAKSAHSYVRMPFHGRSTISTQSQVPRVPTITKRFPIVDSKFSTVKSTFSADWGNKGKLLKPLLVGFGDLYRTLLKNI